MTVTDQIPALPLSLPVGPPTAVRDTDVIIVGTGAAGMTAALQLLESGRRVTMISKDRLGDGSTAWAQGGLAAVTDQADTADCHRDDTMTAGAGLCDLAAVSALTTQAPAAVDGLVDHGAIFDRDAHQALALGLEGGHSRRRVVHAGGDATGAEIARTLAARLGDREASGDHLTILEQTTALDAITDAEGAVGGLKTIDSSGRRLDVRAPAVVLAGGGIGHAWDSTTNPATATGDSIGIALRAGAVIRDPEFVQFHPTMLVVPASHRIRNDRGILISEAVRGEGAQLIDRDGSPIMAGRHPRTDLAPRDVVAATMQIHLLETGADCLYLDGTGLGAQTWRHRFPTILELCRRRGIDPVSEPIPVRPAEHYACGGVLATMDGRTTLSGLYAIGETASTGVHGANRLASNSLTEALITGERLGRLLSTTLNPELVEGTHHTKRPEPVEGRTCWTIAARAREPIVAAISRGAGVLRDDTGLAVLLKSLSDAPVHDQPVTRAEVETTNIFSIGIVVGASARARTESRGCHRRADHSTTEPEWQRHTLARLNDTGTVIVDSRAAR